MRTQKNQANYRSRVFLSINCDSNNFFFKHETHNLEGASEISSFFAKIMQLLGSLDHVIFQIRQAKQSRDMDRCRPFVTAFLKEGRQLLCEKNLRKGFECQTKPEYT